jgi:hypothetical protein
MVEENCHGHETPYPDSAERGIQSLGSTAGPSERSANNCPALPSHLSIKDVIAHLRAWQQRSIARFKAARLNREPEFPTGLAEIDPDAEANTDHMNAWIYESSREQSWSTVHQHWREGFQRFLASGEAIPEKDLLDA